MGVLQLSKTDEWKVTVRMFRLYEKLYLFYQSHILEDTFMAAELGCC